MDYDVITSILDEAEKVGKISRWGWTTNYKNVFAELPSEARLILHFNAQGWLVSINVIPAYYLNKDLLEGWSSLALDVDAVNVMDRFTWDRLHGEE